MLQPTRTRIKICGITSEELALAAAQAGADAIGLVFVNTSPRYVLPGPAQRINRALPPLISAIGVFVNPSDPDLQNWRGQWVQMHGQEEEPQLARVAQNRRIIKGLTAGPGGPGGGPGGGGPGRPGGNFDLGQIARWDRCPHVSALLIDGSSGGKGEQFNHDDLAAMMPAINTPVILAGGLTPDNVGLAIRIVRPFGVDVSSGVETSRGIKSATLIREFCQAVREADAALASLTAPAPGTASLTSAPATSAAPAAPAPASAPAASAAPAAPPPQPPALRSPTLASDRPTGFE